MVVVLVPVNGSVALAGKGSPVQPGSLTARRAAPHRRVGASADAADLACFTSRVYGRCVPRRRTTHATASPPLAFWRSPAAPVCHCNGPQAADARRLLRLLRLHRQLVEQAGGPDGTPAEGLAVSLLPAIEAAAARLRL